MPTYDISAYRSFTFDRKADFQVEAATADEARVVAGDLDAAGQIHWTDSTMEPTGQEDFHPTMTVPLAVIAAFVGFADEYLEELARNKSIGPDLLAAIRASRVGD